MFACHYVSLDDGYANQGLIEFYQPLSFLLKFVISNDIGPCVCCVVCNVLVVVQECIGWGWRYNGLCLHVV